MHTKHALQDQRSEQCSGAQGDPGGEGTPGHPLAWPKHLALAQLWRPSLAPVTRQAPATLSRGTRAQWLHPELHPGFSSSQCWPLRWQRGVTQGQTPSSVTQIQPLAELLPPGPTTSQANGGEVRRSGGHGGNSHGASHFPKPCLAGVHHRSPRMWTLSMTTGKLLTQQMRGTGNSRP